MKNYENVYHVLGLPPVALDVALGKIPLPLADASAPYSVYGFPPALIPMYSESSGPLYCGFWKHHFAERASTIVSLSVEAGYRAREIARNVDQLFAHIVLVAIGVHDGISPEIERFAAGVGIRDLAACARPAGFSGTLVAIGGIGFDEAASIGSIVDAAAVIGALLPESSGSAALLEVRDRAKALHESIINTPKRVFS